MTDNQTSVQTSVQQVDLDIDSWLGAPGADSIVTPTGTDDKKDQKPNIFSQGKFDTSFLDDEDDSDDTDDKDPADDKKVDPAAAKDFIDNLVDDNQDNDDDDQSGKSKGGRPKTEKSGLVEFLKNVLSQRKCLPLMTMMRTSSL